MRRLVVNADDLGADQGRNRGIFEAVESGSVTSVSILANGPGLKDALAHIRRLEGARVSLGIHLNLSEGNSLAGGLRILAGSDGLFRGKAAARELLLRPGPAELEKEVRLEIGAQIRCLQEAGINLSHLDGHQHVHVFPAVAPAALDAAAGHGIPWIRIPDEEPPAGGTSVLSMALAEAGRLFSNLEAEARLFSRLAGEARALLEARALRAPDRFFGLYWKGLLDLRPLEAMARGLPEGLSELMVHPGRVTSRPDPGPFGSFSTPERERELEVLLSPGFREMLSRNGVNLTPFPA